MNVIRKVRAYFVILLIVTLILAVSGVSGRLVNRTALAKETVEAALPTVITVNATRSITAEDLVLPGAVQSFKEAPIYARTDGYLKKWYVDIGTIVKKGQKLAEIDTPEVDQQLKQARADLATARANYALSNSTNERWKRLLTTESVSKQDADEKAGDVVAKKATVDSAAANVDRLLELESFKNVTAPFDGVVTTRKIDVGALISVSQNVGGELFHIADPRTLRVYVQIPETYAPNIKIGANAELRFMEQPGKRYPAQIVRTAVALDPVARTLRVELQLDNAKGELFAGAYAEVHFKLTTNAETLILPANTLMFRSAGLQVATVGVDGHVVLKNIIQGRDFGSKIEILNGIDIKDAVILNPLDSLVSGQLVRIAPPALVRPDVPLAVPAQQKEKGNAS